MSEKFYRKFRLYHKPALDVRGEIVAFYAIFKTVNGGYRFEVMGKGCMDSYAQQYSRSYGRDDSPWKNNYEAMAKKTVIKQLLKYAPMQSDLQQAIGMDESVSNEFAVDMSEFQNNQFEDKPTGKD